MTNVDGCNGVDCVRGFLWPQECGQCWPALGGNSYVDQG